MGVLGCHNDSNDLCRQTAGDVIGSGLHNYAYVPEAATKADFTLRAYPSDFNAGVNVPGWAIDAVMYGSSIVATPAGGGFSGSASAYCGRITRDISCSPPRTVIYDHVPSRLSFQAMNSDTWFCYLFDMGTNGGNIGYPCFYIETGTAASSGATNGDADETVTTSQCHPCTGFSATPKEAICRYENPEGDETGDPDCPYPTVFGVGTLSNKIVFKYDAFSTVLPNGVTDVNFVYTPDSIDVDVWDASTYSGLPVVTSQNPWKTGDDDLNTIIIFEGAALESGIKQGLRVKVRLEAVYDYDNSVFTGTKWTFLELMDPGQNYAVNDTYTLNYTHTHDDLTTSVLTIDLKVSAVGPIEGTAPQAGFDAMREGDTINGHTITKVFHTEFDNFQRHLVYLDGNGNDFTYNTQYTSNRAHQITVFAGKGVKTHSCLMGLYEFYDKSVQYTTESIDGGSPDVYNTLKQPIAEGIITNGTITGFNVYSGGAGWHLLGAPPELNCTTPMLSIGKEAELEPTVTNGAISYIDVTNPGIGYTSAPTVTVSGNATAVAEVTAQVSGEGGYVNRVRITNHGSGYSADATVTFSGGGGSGATAVGKWADGVVTNITVKNAGSGYSVATDEPRAVVQNVHRVDTLKITDGIDASETGIESFYEKLRASRGFPEMINALDRAEDKQVDEMRQRSYESKSTTAPQPNSESLIDLAKNDIYMLAQRRYSKDKVDRYKAIVTKYGIEGVNDVKDAITDESVVGEDFKKEMANWKNKTKEAEKTRLASIEQQCKALAQESVPEYLNYAGTLVSTVQRRFADLPHASKLTKYHMRQYRASSTTDMLIKVTIGCKVEESGCTGSNACPPPTPGAGGTSNNANGGTTTTSYSMSGICGPGAQDWTAYGQLQILNDLTASTLNMSKCVEAYGNPFDI